MHRRTAQPIRLSALSACKPQNVFITCPSLPSAAGVLLKLPLARRRTFKYSMNSGARSVSGRPRTASTDGHLVRPIYRCALCTGRLRIAALATLNE